MDINSVYKVKTRSTKLVNVHVLYLSIFSLISLFVAGSIFFDFDRPSHYKFLGMLPLLYAFGVLMMFNTLKYFLKKISISVILITYFFRMVVIPYFMYLSSYTAVFTYNQYYPEIVNHAVLFDSMNKAIFLMCYEMLLIAVVLAFTKYKDGGFFTHQSIDIKSNKSSAGLFFQITIVALVGFLLGVLFMFPIMGNYVKFFIATSVQADIKNFVAAIEMKETVPSAIYWLYILVFNIVQVFIPIMIVSFIYKIFGFRLRRFGLILNFLVIGIVFAFMTPEKSTSVLLGLVLLLIICLLYPDVMQKRAPVLFAGFGILTLLALLIKSGSYKSEGDQMYEFIAYVLNVYFGGPLNVSAAITMDHTISGQIILSDLFRSIPVVQYFFKDWVNTPDLFNGYILDNNAPSMLIIPMIGQGKFYAGYLFAPFLTVLTVFTAVKFEHISEQTSSLIKKYFFLYATFLFSMAPVMYNLNIVMAAMFIILINLVLVKLSSIKLLENGRIRY